MDDAKTLTAVIMRSDQFGSNTFYYHKPHQNITHLHRIIKAYEIDYEEEYFNVSLELRSDEQNNILFQLTY